MVGSGGQAWSQFWALTVVRDITQVRVFSPNTSHRQAFAARARAELHLAASAVDDAASAVREADIIILATRSSTPVISAADVADGTHLTTVGPKFRSGHETPAELVAAAAIVTCDSPQQAAAYPEPFFTGSAPLVSLSDVLLGAIPGRQHRCDITVHCSVGLACSEGLLAHSLLRSGKKDPAAKVP